MIELIIIVIVGMSIIVHIMIITTDIIITIIKSIRSINIIDIINGMMMIGTMMMAMINIFWKKMQNCCLLVASVLERKISN